MPPIENPPPAERLLRFTLEGAGYALPLPHVAGLASCGVICPVPGAPPEVLGLTEWRGTLLTVLDLPRLLGRSAAESKPSLIRLAPPLHGVALHLAAALRVDPAEPEPERGGGSTGDAPRSRAGHATAWERIDALRLVQRIEAAMYGNA